MRRFQVGDKVRCLKRLTLGHTIGKVYTVQFHERCQSEYVPYDHDPIEGTLINGMMPERRDSHWELVTPVELTKKRYSQWEYA